VAPNGAPQAFPDFTLGAIGKQTKTYNPKGEI